ncbi:MAG: UDP-N-acetylmuramoyl-L-alanyl-D-glutamate--2,6-diaminopimelate ligase [Legionella sp.]|jgi:UDP-N-acetylmuramoyl-L-alanyl-D-glutamate--2,6-diaminopimelate ligase
MDLKILFYNIPGIINSKKLQPIEINGIQVDPNLCQPGFLYVADESETVDSKRMGFRLDGRDFISLAIQNGAKCILTTPEVHVSENVLVIRHKQPLKILGMLYGRFLAGLYPNMIALITGTDGKTSTANFCSMIWAMLGKPSCSIGTLGAQCSDGSMIWSPNENITVPDTLSMHDILQCLPSKGVNHVAAEATSHALYDYRLSGIPASIGAFTNVTQEHLDFHKNMETYFQVKMRLFDEVLESGSYAVLNADSDWFERAYQICKNKKHHIISFGLKGKELRLKQVIKNASGQELILEIESKTYSTQLNLPGLFQAYNALTSLGIIISSGVAVEQALACIPQLKEVEGRLNTVGFTPSGGRVVIDFAHTPNAIKAALKACRNFTKNKLYVLFGPEINVNQAKSKAMGKEASTYADIVIVSDSYTNIPNPALARSYILSEIPNALEISDRPKAIAQVCHMLTKGDTLLIADRIDQTIFATALGNSAYSDSLCVRSIICGMNNTTGG